MGAIINRKQFDRVCSYIEDGLGQKDARLVLGGLPPTAGPLAQGYFVVMLLASAAIVGWLALG